MYSKKTDCLKDYTYRCKIGSGGFCKVSWYTKDNIDYAVKFFRASDKAYESYLKEIDLMKQLDHPNIVKVYSGQTVPYGSNNQNLTGIMIMEYCHNGSLADRIKRHRETNQKFPPQEVFKFLYQTLSALDYAVNKPGVNIVHRDIKPENILIDISGNYKVCDFGIGKVIQNKNCETLTFADTGTKEYIPPEFEDQKMYRGKGDIWSLGVTLYYMCEFKFPFPPCENVFKIFERYKNAVIPDLTGEYFKYFNKCFKAMVVVAPEKRCDSQNLLSYIQSDPNMQQLGSPSIPSLPYYNSLATPKSSKINEKVGNEFYNLFNQNLSKLDFTECRNLLTKFEKEKGNENVRIFCEAKINFFIGRYSKAKVLLSKFNKEQNPELYFDSFRMIIEIEIFQKNQNKIENIKNLIKEGEQLLKKSPQNKTSNPLQAIYLSEALNLGNYYIFNRIEDSIENQVNLIKFVKTKNWPKIELGRLIYILATWYSRSTSQRRQECKNLFGESIELLSGVSSEEKNPLLGRAYYYLGHSNHHLSLHLMDFEHATGIIESALNCFLKAQTYLNEGNSNLYYYSIIMAANCFLRLNNIPKYLEIMKYIVTIINQCESLETKLFFQISYASGLYNLTDYESSHNFISQAYTTYEEIINSNSVPINQKDSVKLSKFAFILWYNNEIISYYLNLNQKSSNNFQLNLNSLNQFDLQKISELKFKFLLKSNNFPMIENEYRQLMNNTKIEKDSYEFKFLHTYYFLKMGNYQEALKFFNNIDAKGLIYNEDAFFYYSLKAIINFYNRDYVYSLIYFNTSQNIFSQLESPNIQLICDLFFNQGVCNYVSNQFRDSLDCFNRIFSSYEKTITSNNSGNYIRSIINALVIKCSPKNIKPINAK